MTLKEFYKQEFITEGGSGREMSLTSTGDGKIKEFIVNKYGDKEFINKYENEEEEDLYTFIHDLVLLLNWNLEAVIKAREEAGLLKWKDEKKLKEFEEKEFLKFCNNPERDGSDDDEIVIVFSYGLGFKVDLDYGGTSDLVEQNKTLENFANRFIKLYNSVMDDVAKEIIKYTK